LDTNNDIYLSIGGQNPGIYLSTDNGNSWINYGLSSQIANSVTCLAVDTSGYVWAGAHLDGVYRTAGRTVPVELGSFNSELDNNNVLLSWITASEINNQGFEIERAIIGQQSAVISEWERIGFVEGSGTTTETKTYSYVDENVISGTYLYRLKQIDFDGSFEYSKVIEMGVLNPTDFILNQNFPNPFNSSTVIKYSIPNIGNESVHLFPVTLKVYDILGNEIIVLVNEEKPAGNFEVMFEAVGLASGVYFYKLTSGGNIQTRKLIFMK